MTWVWAGNNHSTTAAAGQLETWDSGVHSQPFSFSHTFTELGTFTYRCTIHGSAGGCSSVSGMSGKIIVVLPDVAAYRVTSITREGNDIRVNWTTGGSCKTNFLQRATSPNTNNYADIFIATNTVGNFTNYLDMGAAASFPARYYRVRVP